MHHLQEFIQNGHVTHHCIVFISMGLYYRHLSNNCYCCFRNTTCNMESFSRWNIILFILVRANIQVWFERFAMLWHPFPMAHIPGSAILVVIRFGLAPVYTGAMSIVFLQSFVLVVTVAHVATTYVFMSPFCSYLRRISLAIDESILRSVSIPTV